MTEARAATGPLAAGPGRAGHPPTVAEVARAAGVSTQTVSRVVNGQPHVRPEKRDRVNEVIARLGYRPSDAARALASLRRR